MKKARQIAAIIGIIILVGMYVVTLIAAITSSEHTHGLFLASLFASLVVPVFIWVFMRLYKLTHKEGSMSIRQAKKAVKEAELAASAESFKEAGLAAKAAADSTQSEETPASEEK